MQDYRYVFNPVTGNLTSRQNALGTDLIETFTYDNLDRLTKVQKGTTTLTTTLQMGYATNGNITSKSDIGTVFEYTKAGSPYALTAVESSAGEIPLATQTATYTSFEKVNTISEAGYTATFTYNSDGQRAQMIERQGSTTTLTRWYPTASYMKEKKGSVTSEYTWIGGDAYTAPVLIMKTGAVTYLYFLLRDHLGNITHVMNEYMVIYEYSYDAWGRRRNKTNWSYTLDNNDRELLGDRGFAGHEYLGNFKLYNMNGRMYDPLVGRFLSPDPYVQAPDFTQNLNRYSYALNNPLKYEDPDGEWLEQIAWPFFFFVDLLSNVINGVDHPGKNAAKNATTMLNGMSNAAQINIYSDENTKITVGINPFTFDLSANIYSRAGDKGIFHQGFGIGANSGPYMDFDASIYFDKFNLSMGFGGGNNYSGWNASITWPKGWGIGYGTTNYGNAIGPDGKSNAQIVGSFTAFFPKGSFNLQNDFLAFSGQDRWRTSAWELNIGDWSLGSSVYTNDPLNDYGQDDFIAPGYSPTWGPNTDGFGEWYNGQVYSSPLWIGHRSGNTISRIGYSHWRVQDATQNGIHRYFPLGRQNYYTGYDYFQGGMKGKWYGYSGYYNPFSLYQ